MVHEFVGWLTYPVELDRNERDFDKFMESEVISPLRKGGYEVVCIYAGVLWSLVKEGVKVTLEYCPNDGGFACTVDKRANATRVYKDFVEHTPLREWKPDY